MGDREFEDFLDGKESEDNDEHGEDMLECQKALLFDIIQQKMDNSTNLINYATKLHLKEPSPIYKEWLNDLIEISRQSFNQLDWLMSAVIEEIDDVPESEK